MSFDVVKSHFQTEGKQHSLITLSDASWINSAQATWGVKPLVLNVGRCVVKAIGFAEGIGLYQPKLAHLESKISGMGCNMRDEKDLRRLASGLTVSNSKVVLELPLRIYHLALGHFEIFTQSQALGINFCFLDPVPKALKVIDSLSSVREFLTDPKKKYGDFHATYSVGSCKLITEQTIITLAKEIFSKFGEFETFGKSPYKISIVKLDTGTQIILHKNAGLIDLYPLFEKFLWKGSYKTVFLSLKISQTLTPAGLSTSEDIEESKKEIFFRKHAQIAPLLTPLYLEWEAETQYNLVHGWAARGTLQDVILKPMSLAEKDEIACQLLEKMSVFHQFAIHKDLNINNIIVDHTAAGIQVHINDVGGSALKTNAEDMKEVAVNSYNLAPELLRECAKTQGYFWDSLFEADFSASQWELSERFQVAIMISQIYLGTHPYSLLQNKASIEEKYPLRDLAFRDLRTLYASCYKLDEFLSSIELEELKKCYVIAYDRMHSKELSKFSALIQTTAAELLGTSIDSEERQKEHEELALHHFNTLSLRQNLEPYLEDLKETTNLLYRAAYKRMDFTCRTEVYSDLAKIIAEASRPLIELVPDLPARTEGRIVALLPLLDLDPSKRPPLQTILSSFKASIGR